MSALSSDPNLHLIIYETDLEKALVRPDRNKIEMALKKAALYASKAIILKKPQEYTEAISGGWRDTATDTWSGGEVSARLRELYESFGTLAAFQSAFCFLPERLDHRVEEWTDPDNWMTSEPSAVFEFSAKYSNRFGVAMSFGDPTTNAHVFETLRCSKNDVSVLNVWLPELSHVPLDVLLKVREDEADSFGRFQFVLKGLVADSDDVDSEAKLKEIFQRVDYEVRVFESRMNQVRKTRALRAYEAILGFSIMGLCFALPSDVAKIVSSFIGMYEGKEFISFIFREREHLNNLRSSDFYVPWLLTKKEKT